MQLIARLLVAAPAARPSLDALLAHPFVQLNEVPPPSY